MDSGSGHLKYMVCHDGSQASIDAVRTVQHSLLKNHDELVVAHAWSREKESYLKFDMKA